MSRFDNEGLFWVDIDNKTIKMQTYLTENGWLPHGATKWYKRIWETREQPFKEMAMLLVDAYVEARKPVKREPPERVWEVEGFIPSQDLLEEALKFDVDLYTDSELIQASLDEVPLIFDIECYINYFLIAFISTINNKVIFFEFTPESILMDTPKFRWVMENFLIVGFNSRNYDIPIAAIALAGCSNKQLKEATNLIIGEQMWAHHVLRRFKAKKLENIDHIDIIEVAPLSANLKIYGGRVHTKKMQDLPFRPEITLTPDQIAILRFYCINDLFTTRDLFNTLKKQLKIRGTLSIEHGIDLRSKSDAQIAEAVINEELTILNGHRVHRPTIEPGTWYNYDVPNFIEFQSELMADTLSVIASTKFIVGDSGNIGMPEELKDIAINLGYSTYTIGIGGLHSTEHSITHYSDKNTILIDRDVESYYPRIILNQGLYPKHLGRNFLKVYDKIVTTRLAAKKAGNKSVADTLKIVINGSFGKLGSKYSNLYAPKLLIQVTMTGQLSLLMLIERIEWVGIPVVSANTDGIVIKCPRAREDELNNIVAIWEKDTNFITDENKYSALYSKDVNNYIAIKENGTTKGKGAYSTPGLQKNPTSLICVDAVIKFLTTNVAIETTIKECLDITKFITVRTVKGGAVKDGVYLGKAVRWYYAVPTNFDEDYLNEIIYAKSGNKVPKSEGAKPLMELPDTLPDDIDYDRYLQESYSILVDIGHTLE